ncbi:NAD(P)/FAD-dependent oxidoreductase [Labrys sp. ZIDIC5]|uniref:FAD-dependent oxidoreductase n=1 Tax=Labrys sedimenti TaxID=3106036 RepID=UPI002ACA876C|nr:NAD(P)/FAD-dependent oxidoreductase [Labrys sp. ZIDIC5]MDZ5453979.1 NAD(P)/FAD-dependent oxidoreductase [Labrys sp. ZIDIC5]
MSNVPEKRNLSIIIVGAGTGGLCLAHGLKRAGIAVNVFERDRTRKDGLQGFRVGIDPDGCRALDANLPPALYETFLATCAVSPQWFNMLSEHYGELLSLKPSPPRDPRHGERSVSRMTLRQVLLTGLEDVTHFDKVFSRYEQHPDGKVEAFFEDGSSAVADLLVAADGSNSRIRRQYLPQAGMDDTLIRSIGGKVPATPETLALLTPKIHRGVTLILAPGGFGAILHVMEFPWDEAGAPKQGIGATDADLIAQWPGLRFDNSRDYISWGIWAAADKFPEDLRAMNGNALLALSQRLTATWHPDWRKLLAASDPNSLFPVVIRTSVPIEAWTPSSVTLLGDAIHTMTPGRGVGANTALRDAALLTRHLQAVQEGRSGLVAAIGAYEAEMRRYSAEAVERSRRQMDGRTAIHKPVIGRILLACQRTTMRLINVTPPLKRKMLRSLEGLRGGEREVEGQV